MCARDSWSGNVGATQWNRATFSRLLPQPDATTVSRHLYTSHQKQSRTLRRIAKKTGLQGVAPADEQAFDGKKALTRLHLARAIVDAGHAPSISSVFNQWLRKEEMLDHFPTAQDMISQIKRVGGLCFWAHPEMEKVSLHAKTLKDAGA